MEYARGIDVSSYQGMISWERVFRDGISFAMIKATQGRGVSDPALTLFTDSRFAYNLPAAYESGVRCGVYHYLTAATVPEARREAEYFLRVLSAYREKITLYAAVDVEDAKYLPRDKNLLTEIVNTFCETVAADGYMPAVYTNPDFLVYRLNDVSRWRLWLALWRDVSKVPQIADYPSLSLWQYGSGIVDGIPNICDVNLELVPPTQREEPLPTYAEMAAFVAQRAGLSDVTIDYLFLYKYGNDLFRKLYLALLEREK